MSEYMPSTEDVRIAYICGGSYRHPGRGEYFDRWLAAHDAEIHEQVAREVYTHLPIMLRDQATDGCGWLSDMDGVWLDHGTDVSTPSGSIDVDQIGEYAARIARGGEGE